MQTVRIIDIDPVDGTQRVHDQRMLTAADLLRGYAKPQPSTRAGRLRASLMRGLALVAALAVLVAAFSIGLLLFAVLVCVIAAATAAFIIANWFQRVRGRGRMPVRRG
jgi:fatty acid desaturase